MNTTELGWASQERQIVSHEYWIAARKELLKKEKASVRLLDELSRERRKLPWVRVEEHYVFDGAGGEITLAELFAGRRQLAVYHFMFGPDWEEGCPSCSFVSDHLDGAIPHLSARDVTLVAVSRAPITKLDAFKKRMGWHFNWVSSLGNNFNRDFRVSFTEAEKEGGKVNYNYTTQEFPSTEAPGMSVFYKDARNRIFHTYSTYSRGLDQFLTAYRILDSVPKGRDEDELPFPMAWVRYHDRYETNEFADANKPYWPDSGDSPLSCGCGKMEARG